MLRPALALFSAFALAVSAMAQDEPVVWRGARVLTGDGQSIDDAVLVVVGGRIQTIGGPATAVPAGSRLVEARGMVITPGLIDAAWSGGSAVGAMDLNEQSTEVTPSLHVLDTLDPMDKAIARVRSQGVTTVHVMPGTRSVIGGLSCVLQTWGKDQESMVLSSEAALRMTLGAEPSMGNRAIRGGSVESIYYRRPTTRMGVIWSARRALYDAKEMLDESQAQQQVARTAQERRDLSVLARVLKGTLPMVTTARSEQDLRTALRLSTEFGYTPVIDEAQDAHSVVAELSAARVWVMVGAPSASSVGGPGGQDGAEPRYATVLRLRDAGVNFVITTGTNANALELIREAMFAHRFGLTRDEALAAVTTQPAKLLGLQDKKGALKPGMDADFVVWSADPFDPSSTPSSVVIGGIDTTSLQ